MSDYNIAGLFAIEGDSDINYAEIIDIINLNLQSKGYHTKVISFSEPNEQSFSPYANSIFSAVERHQTSKKIKQHIANGNIVILNRYSVQTMASQAKLFSTLEERRAYYLWLDNLDYFVLNNARPQASFILSTGNNELLTEVCNFNPADFNLIDCVRSDKQISNDQIAKILWDKLSTLLPEPTTLDYREPVSSKSDTGATTAPESLEYIVPETLDETTRLNYISDIETILTKYTELKQRLVSYLKTVRVGEDVGLIASSLAKAVLPVAIGQTSNPTNLYNPEKHKQLRQLADKYLPGQYGQSEQPVRLTSVWPRNELEIVEAILYSQSHLSQAELAAEVTKWNYQQKSEVYEAFIKSILAGDNTSLVTNKIQYDFDLLTSYQSYDTLKDWLNNDQTELQLLTPRYGYAVPDIIVEAGLEEPYQDCFDISLGLNSKLVAAGYEFESQYACLLGHKMRWQVTIAPKELFVLQAENKKISHSDTQQLIAEIVDLQTEKHPLLSEIIASELPVI